MATEVVLRCPLVEVTKKTCGGKKVVFQQNTIFLGAKLKFINQTENLYEEKGGKEKNCMITLVKI